MARPEYIFPVSRENPALSRYWPRFNAKTIDLDYDDKDEDEKKKKKKKKDDDKKKDDKKDAKKDDKKDDKEDSRDDRDDGMTEPSFADTADFAPISDDSTLGGLVSSVSGLATSVGDLFSAPATAATPTVHSEVQGMFSSVPSTAELSSLKSTNENRGNEFGFAPNQHGVPSRNPNDLGLPAPKGNIAQPNDIFSVEPVGPPASPVEGSRFGAVPSGVKGTEAAPNPLGSRNDPQLEPESFNNSIQGGLFGVAPNVEQAAVSIGFESMPSAAEMGIASNNNQAQALGLDPVSISGLQGVNALGQVGTFGQANQASNQGFNTAPGIAALGAQPSVIGMAEMASMPGLQATPASLSIGQPSPLGGFANTPERASQHAIEAEVMSGLDNKSNVGHVGSFNALDAARNAENQANQAEQAAVAQQSGLFGNNPASNVASFSAPGLAAPNVGVAAFGAPGLATANQSTGFGPIGSTPSLGNLQSAVAELSAPIGSYQNEQAIGLPSPHPSREAGLPSRNPAPQETGLISRASYMDDQGHMVSGAFGTPSPIGAQGVEGLGPASAGFGAAADASLGGFGGIGPDADLGVDIGLSSDIGGFGAADAASIGDLGGFGGDLGGMGDIGAGVGNSGGIGGASGNDGAGGSAGGGASGIGSGSASDGIGASGGLGGGEDSDASSGAEGADGDCVIATANMATGRMSRADRARAIRLCKQKLHGHWIGETVRLGYRKWGRDHIAAGRARDFADEFNRCVLQKTWKDTINLYARWSQFFCIGLVERMRG